MAAIATVLAAVALPTAAFSPVTPNLSLDTVPIAYFGGNAGKRGPANLEMLAKMRMIMIEKWEGHCWEDCLATPGSEACEPSCDAEHDMVSTLKAVKALNPAVSGVFYLNTLMAFPFYSLQGKYLDQDALTKDSQTGKPIVIRNDNGMEGVYIYGFDTSAGRQLYVDAIKNLTATGFVDGFFGDKWSHGATQNKNGAWQICPRGTNPPTPECGSVSAEQASAWNAGKATVLAEVTAHVGEGPYWGNGDAYSLGPGDPVPCNTGGWWRMDKFKDPRDLIAQVNIQLSQHTYVTMGTDESRWDTDPNSTKALQSACDENCLARFLLAVEEGMMLITNGWDTAYDKPLGKPLGPAVFQQASLPATLTRQFESGTKVVFTYDEKQTHHQMTGKGVVTWGGEPPSPPPTPSSLMCGGCGSSYLVDTTFGKDDVDVAETTSSQSCCELCAAKDGCIEWAWHGGSDSSCHMHGSNSFQRYQTGTTSGVMDASCSSAQLLV